MSKFALALPVKAVVRFFVETAQAGQAQDAGLAEYRAKMRYTRSGIEFEFDHEEDRDRFVKKYLFDLIEKD